MSTTPRIAATGALILSLAAAGAPTATALTEPGTTTANTAPSGVYSRQDKSITPTTSSWVVRPNPDEQTPPPTQPAIVRVTDGSAGFDWGDAGIGAAGGVALTILGLGGALTVSQRRPRRNPHTTSLS